MTEVSDVVALRDLLATRWVGYAIHAAAALDLAGVLLSGPRTASDIAASVKADPLSVERLLRALTTIGLFEQVDDGYAVTSTGALLSATSPTRLRDHVLLTSGERSLLGWAQLAACVQTGGTAAKILEGVDDPFAALAAQPEGHARFNSAMAGSTGQVADAVAEAYDFSGVGTIVDVGGGYGTLLPPVLRAHPAVRATVFDLPACADGARRVIEQEGLGDRYAFVGGDFFSDPLPAGADVYVIKSVIHDWDDQRSAAILGRCREAMREDSRLLVVEVVLPDRLERTAEHRRMMWADLNMMVATGGRERTESEYRSLFQTSGLRIERILPTDTPTAMSVVETRRL